MDSKEMQSPGLLGDDDPTCLRIARSSSAGASTESYMQSFMRQQQHKSSMTMNTMTPPLPQPVAMSLRARETASMSLKHIFEQQMSNGASSRDQDCKYSTSGQQMGGFQGMRNQSMPDLRKRIPELDLTFRKAQEGNFAYAQAGFGSPISSPTSTSQDLMSQAPLPKNGQLMQHSHMHQAAAPARCTLSSRQPTAQMTIFYSGNVNVYDDVPADKAHAIMLLAGNSWSTSSFRCPPVPAAAPSMQTEGIPMKERAPSPIKAAPSPHETPALMTKSNSSGGGIARNVPAPASTSSVAAIAVTSPLSPVPASLGDGGANTPPAGVPARRPHAGIELPHARKASLARFLEKRKDRAQVQQVNPDQQGGAVGEKGEGDGGETASCNGKPDHLATSMNSKRHCTRSRSPSPSRSTSNISNRDHTAIIKTMNVEDESSSQKGNLNEHYFFH